MTRHQLLGWSLFTLAAASPPAFSQSTSGAAAGSKSSGTAATAQSQTSTSSAQGITDAQRLGVASAFGGFWTGYHYYVVGTPGGPYTFVPPVVFWGQPSAMPIAPGNAFPTPVAIERGPIAPPPPAGLVEAPAADPAREVLAPRRGDAARAAQYLTIGDRLFRNDNYKKAEERYLQAARVDPQSALPLVRLAQIAFVREQYRVASQRFREAETVQPGWIVTAPDIQAMFGEPKDFADRLARLESHLQVHPGDRDAWLVLGAELFLSGRTERAGDVFLRLNDPRRRPDVALAAFLHASRRE